MLSAGTKIYPEKYREDAGTTIIMDEYKGLGEMGDYMIDFCLKPRVMTEMFTAKTTKAGRELAFDLSAKQLYSR